MQKEEEPIEVIYGKSTTASVDSGCDDTNNGTKKEEVPIEIIYGKKDDGRDTTFEGREILQKPERPMEIIYGKSDNNSIDNAGSSSDDDSDSDDSADSSDYSNGGKVEPPREGDMGEKLTNDMLLNSDDDSSASLNTEERAQKATLQHMFGTGVTSNDAAYSKSDELTKEERKKYQTDMTLMKQQKKQLKKDDKALHKSRVGREFSGREGHLFLIECMQTKLVFAVANSKRGKEGGVSAALPGVPFAPDSLFGMIGCIKKINKCTVYPKGGWDVYGVVQVTRIIKKEDCDEESIVDGVTSDGIRVVNDKELQKLQQKAESNKVAFEAAKEQIRNAGDERNGIPAGQTKAHFLFYNVNKRGEKIEGVIAKATTVRSCITLVGTKDKYQKDFTQGYFEWGVGNGRLWECAKGTHHQTKKMPYHGKSYWIEMITVALSKGKYASVRKDPSTL